MSDIVHTIGYNAPVLKLISEALAAKTVQNVLIVAHNEDDTISLVYNDDLNKHLAVELLDDSIRLLED